MDFAAMLGFNKKNSPVAVPVPTPSTNASNPLPQLNIKNVSATPAVGGRQRRRRSTRQRLYGGFVNAMNAAAAANSAVVEANAAENAANVAKVEANAAKLAANVAVNEANAAINNATTSGGARRTRRNRNRRNRNNRKTNKTRQNRNRRNRSNRNRRNRNRSNRSNN